MIEEGMPLASKPEVLCPELPAKCLAELEATSFASLYQAWVAWQGYVIEQSAQVKAELVETRNRKRIFEAELRQKVKDLHPRPSKEEVGDSTLLNAGYRELLEDEQKQEQRRLILEAKLANLDQRIKLASRQVELRRQGICHRPGQVIGQRSAKLIRRSR